MTLFLLRILLAAGLFALGVWVFRRVYASMPRVEAPKEQEPQLISKIELASLTKIRAPLLEEALSLRPRILEVTDDPRIAIATDNLVREVARAVEHERRIAEALAEIDDARLGEQLSDADDRLRAAKDADARRLAEGTIERLMALRDGRDKLRARRDELATRTKHLVLELRGSNLALLEASSAAGLAGDRVEEIRARLKQACEDAQRTAVAEEEVARLIAKSAGRETES